ERAERLAERHPADAVPLSELALGGEPVAGGEAAALHGGLERRLDLCVGRPSTRLDRRSRQRHYGLDFSMVTDFHPLWLRDNCPCPDCRHESGQRLLDTRAIPDDLSVVSVHGSTVRFSDGHESTFDPGWLVEHAAEPERRASRLWGAEIQDALPVVPFDA